jgi:hypothetical protein
MSSKNLRVVQSCTSLCGDVRNWIGFDTFRKVVYKCQQVLVLRNVTKYGPAISMDVTSKGDVGASVLANGATNFLFSFCL